MISKERTYFIKMKEFKIFIASSNDEKEERNTLKELILFVSRFTHNYGIEFLPVMWELESVDFMTGFTEKQKEYNEKLVSSDMVFFLFGKRVGKNTHEEFRVACNQVQKNRYIKVYVYFKNVEMGGSSSITSKDAENLQEVNKLKDTISNKLE